MKYLDQLVNRTGFAKMPKRKVEFLISRVITRRVIDFGELMSFLVNFRKRMARSDGKCFRGSDHRLTSLKIIGLLLIAGFASALNTIAASAQAGPVTQTISTAKAIDAILYTNSSREEILAKLKPYAAPMQSMEDVQKRIEFGLCFGSGPGIMQCQVANSGLTLVFDPDKKLRLMRRDSRVVDGTAYPEMSITDRGFEWHGYQRWYEN